MNRRLILAIAAMCALAAQNVLSQPSGRMHRIAYVGIQLFDSKIFRERLAERGYTEGKNVETRLFGATAATPEAVSNAAKEALSWNPDVIRVGFTKNVRVVAALTSTVPIVFDNVNDPVASGFVSNWARPDRNLTGVAVMNAELTSKRLELLRDLIPQAKRVGLIVESAGSPFSSADMDAIRLSALRLGFDLQVVDPSPNPRHTVGAFESIANARLDAVVSVLTSVDARDYAALGLREGSAPLTNVDLNVDFQRTHRIPIVGGTTAGVERGLLAMLGGTQEEQMQVVADQTAKVLAGRPIRDVPVQQLMRIEVGINLKTAKELGITVPQSVLVRADRVIQ